jgi:hypothetical protein
MRIGVILSHSALRAPSSMKKGQRRGTPNLDELDFFYPEGVEKPQPMERGDVILRERTTCNQKTHKNLRATEGPSFGLRGARFTPQILPLDYAGRVLRSAPKSCLKRLAARAVERGRLLARRPSSPELQSAHPPDSSVGARAAVKSAGFGVAPSSE